MSSMLHRSTYLAITLSLALLMACSANPVGTYSNQRGQRLVVQRLDNDSFMLEVFQRGDETPIRAVGTRKGNVMIGSVGMATFTAVFADDGKSVVLDAMADHFEFQRTNTN